MLCYEWITEDLHIKATWRQPRSEPSALATTPGPQSIQRRSSTEDSGRYYFTRSQSCRLSSKLHSLSPEESRPVRPASFVLPARSYALEATYLTLSVKLIWQYYSMLLMQLTVGDEISGPYGRALPVYQLLDSSPHLPEFIRQTWPRISQTQCYRMDVGIDILQILSPQQRKLLGKCQSVGRNHGPGKDREPHDLYCRLTAPYGPEIF
jgi:hypothetical protein